MRRLKHGEHVRKTKPSLPHKYADIGRVILKRSPQSNEPIVLVIPNESKNRMPIPSQNAKQTRKDNASGWRDGAPSEKRRSQLSRDAHVQAYAIYAIIIMAALSLIIAIKAANSEAGFVIAAIKFWV